MKNSEKPAPVGPSDRDLDSLLRRTNSFKPATVGMKQQMRLQKQKAQKQGFDLDDYAKPAKGGKWKPNYAVLEKIRELAKTGLSIKRIAPCIGMWPTTLARRMDRYPELRAAYEMGKAGGCAEVAKGLYKNATEEGNVTAQALYLKEHDDWGNKQELKVSGSLNVQSAWTINVVASDGEGNRGETTGTITVAPKAVSHADPDDIEDASFTEQGDCPEQSASTQGESRYEQEDRENVGNLAEDLTALMNARAAARWR